MIQFVVPQLHSGGVYDFACHLQEAIGESDVCLIHLSALNVAGWKIGPSDMVVLQMSGYGFDKRGAPLWLLHELEKRRKHIKTFGVFFHELYAFGPPWSSSFWLSPVQRHIARRIAELSDFWMTNREESAQWLGRFVSDKAHAVLPVFSNVGELKALPKARLPRVVVFGSTGLRQATYKAAGDKLFAWVRSKSLEIHDIGAPMADRQLADRLRARGIVMRGRLGEEEVSQAMKDAMFGLLAYPVEYVAKSGVFAAYCAHGVCPVLMSENYARADGLVAGRQYISGFEDRTIAIAAASAVGQSAYEWYQPHTLKRHADAIRGFMRDREGL